VVVTILSGNFVALFLIHSAAFLFSFVLSPLLWYLVALLLSLVVSDLLILTLFSVFSGAVLFRYLVAFLLGHNRSYRLLDILALADRDWTADWLVVGTANLFCGVLCIGNIFVFAVLFRDLIAVLPRFIPAFLPWLIPAFLMSINVTAFLLSNSPALFFIDSVTRLLVPGVALLFLLILCHRLLHIMAILLSNIVTLFLSYKVTLLLRNIVNLGFVLGVALLLITGVAFLFRNILTLLLWNTLNRRHLN